MQAKHIISITQALRIGCSIELAGKTYTFTALTLGDLGDIVQWQKDRQLGSYLRVAREQAIPRPERFRDMHDIQSRCAREEDYDSKEPATLRRMAWYSLRHAHPDMTEADVEELISRDDVGDLVIDIMLIQTNAPMEFDESGGSSSDPFPETGTSPPSSTTSR